MYIYIIYIYMYIYTYIGCSVATQNLSINLCPKLGDIFLYLQHLSIISNTIYQTIHLK